MIRQRNPLVLSFSLLALWLIIACAVPVATSAQESSATTPPPANAGPITARMLIAPNALMGAAPAAFNWSPTGARLTYLDVEDGQEVLVLFDAATGDKEVLLAVADSPAGVDLSLTQWSPQGDTLLLSGGNTLWLLDVTTGALRQVGDGAGAKTGVTFLPGGAHISYVQGNDIYRVALADDATQRLTTDGGETVFNGILDWVYNLSLIHI